MSAILAIFHSLFILWNLFAESLVPSPLIFVIALSNRHIVMKLDFVLAFAFNIICNFRSNLSFQDLFLLLSFQFILTARLIDLHILCIVLVCTHTISLSPTLLARYPQAVLVFRSSEISVKIVNQQDISINTHTVSDTHVFISVCESVCCKSEQDRSMTTRKQFVCMYQPRCVSDGSEDAAVAEDDDGERDEEDNGKEQDCVGADRRGKRHVVPGTRRHQPLWDVRTCGRTYTL